MQQEIVDAYAAVPRGCVRDAQISVVDGKRRRDHHGACGANQGFKIVVRAPFREKGTRVCFLLMSDRFYPVRTGPARCPDRSPPARSAGAPASSGNGAGTPAPWHCPGCGLRS